MLKLHSPSAQSTRRGQHTRMCQLQHSTCKKRFCTLNRVRMSSQGITSSSQSHMTCASSITRWGLGLPCGGKGGMAAMGRLPLLYTSAGSVQQGQECAREPGQTVLYAAAHPALCQARLLQPKSGQVWQLGLWM